MYNFSISLHTFFFFFLFLFLLQFNLDMLFPISNSPMHLYSYFHGILENYVNIHCVAICVGWYLNCPSFTFHTLVILPIQPCTQESNPFNFLLLEIKANTKPYNFLFHFLVFIYLKVNLMFPSTLSLYQVYPCIVSFLDYCLFCDCW